MRARICRCAGASGWLVWARDDTPIPLLLSAARVHAPGGGGQRRHGRAGRRGSTVHDSSPVGARARAIHHRAGTAHRRPRRLRLHGRHDQGTRLRVRLRQPGLQLPRSPRVGDQLRRQREARAAHLHARRVGGGHGARLLQDRGDVARGDGTRDSRTAARVDGALQRVVRSRAGLPGARQHARCDAAGTRSGVGAQRAGCGSNGARLYEMGRHASVAAALRRIGSARLQNRDDTAVRPRGDRRRQRASGTSHCRPSRRTAGAAADARRPAAGRFGRRRRSGEASRCGRLSAPDRRSPRPHSRGARTTDRARRAAAGGGHQHAAELPAADRRWADELSQSPPAQPDAARRRTSSAISSNARHVRQQKLA
jgi:hypothetical protein